MGFATKTKVFFTLAPGNAHWRLYWRHPAGYTKEHAEELEEKLSVIVCDWIADLQIEK